MMMKSGCVQTARGGIEGEVRNRYTYEKERKKTDGEPG